LQRDYANAEARLALGLSRVEKLQRVSMQAWFLHATGRVAAHQQKWSEAQAAFRREAELLRFMKRDDADAVAEIEAVRRRQIVPRSRQHSGWI